jgi:thiamine-monophosphate kinase
MDAKAAGPLVDHYRRPVPLLAAGQAIAPNATAMMDISDGLLIDLSRLCEASRCGSEVRLDALPLSAPFVADCGDGREARLFAATGGDDYALLAALPDGLDPLSLSLPKGSRVTEIGRLTEGSGISLFDADGPVELPETLGYEHYRT